MRDPLENIVIGNFLYGLGLSMGQRAGNKASVGCVNLLQQTPLDRPLGDVFIRFTGAVRLFEFKRSTASKLKELRKLTVLQARQPETTTECWSAIHVLASPTRNPSTTDMSPEGML